MEEEFQTRMVFTLTRPSSIPMEKRPKSRGKDVKDTLTKQTLETVLPLYLQAEEKKPESPKKLHFC